jgi:hypothetical protein
MQINISAEQVRMIRDWAEPAIVPFLIWLYRRSVKAMDTALNKIITENSNRNRDELIGHIDRKFTEHEHSAFARIAALEDSSTALARSVDELRALVGKYQDELRPIKEIIKK